MARIISLNLSNFRNHHSLSLTIDPSRPVILSGPNGAGKTSILEAISLLHPGAGIRSASVRDMCFEGKDWKAVFIIDVSDDDGDIGTYSVALLNGKKTIKVNGKAVKGYNAIIQHFSFAWLNPEIDIIMSESASELRKFFDRLIVASEVGHADHLVKYDQVRKLRAKVLAEDQSNNSLLCVLEKAMAEEAVKIARNRVVFLGELAKKLQDCCFSLPTPEVSIDGFVEKQLENGLSDIVVIGKFADLLASRRSADLRAGRTGEGTHRSKFIVSANRRNAVICSMGEQKLFLFKVMIASSDRGTILLFDDLGAHIDRHYQKKIWEILPELPVQSWITDNDCRGYDPAKYNLIALPIDVKIILDKWMVDNNNLALAD